MYWLLTPDSYWIPYPHLSKKIITKLSSVSTLISVISRAIVYSMTQEYKHKIFKAQNSIIKLVINEPVYTIAVGTVASLLYTLYMHTLPLKIYRRVCFVLRNYHGPRLRHIYSIIPYIICSMIWAHTFPAYHVSTINFLLRWNSFGVLDFIIDTAL